MTVTVATEAVSRFTSLWRSRQVLRRFLIRDIKNRYLGSVSGTLWVFLQPLAQLLIFSFVFSAIFQVRFPELQNHNFLTFVAVGFWPWIAFAEAQQRATISIQNNADLLKKVSLPSELFVFSAIGATYAVHLAGYLLILILLSVTGEDIHWLALPAVFVLLAMQIGLVTGLALLLASFQVFLRDLEQLLVPVIAFWFYATPILYPLHMVPAAFQTVMQSNPMTYYVETIRQLLLFGSWTPGWYDVGALVGMVAVLALGWIVFRRLAPRFVDFL